MISCTLTAYVQGAKIEIQISVTLKILSLPGEFLVNAIRFQ